MIYNPQSTPEIEELIAAWQQYIASMSDWQQVVEGIEPKQTYCGPVYEPVSPLARPNESFAIADMRNIKVAEPHYHTGGEIEVYFVLSGTGLVVVGGEELRVQASDVIVTPPQTAHFTIPKENLVLVAINTPPFNPQNSIHIDESDPAVGFDKAQLERLTHAKGLE